MQSLGSSLQERHWECATLLALAAISAFGAGGTEIRLQYFVWMCPISYKKLELRSFCL